MPPRQQTELYKVMKRRIKTLSLDPNADKKDYKSEQTPLKTLRLVQMLQNP